jgi:glycosyltransferase involved in cell wall biosynthesis
VSEKTVAVIIPTADRGEMLNRAIASVLAQTVAPDEVIVVDNGRSDALISDDYIDRISLLRTQPRIGPGVARNVGVEKASTQYVSFLDDDDYWEADYLEQSLLLIDEHDVVVGQLKRKGPDGLVRPYKLFPADEEGQRGVYFRNPGFGGQNILIDRSFVLRVGGFDRKMPASVDRDLAAKIIEKGGRIGVQPLSVAVLCDHEGPRVRGSQVRGNRMFIMKHWRHMSIREFKRAFKTYLKRRKKLKASRQLSA